MSQNLQYDFCPRCGALMHNGVCQSCEYVANATGAGNTANVENSANNANNTNNVNATMDGAYQNNNAYANQNTYTGQNTNAYAGQNTYTGQNTNTYAGQNTYSGQNTNTYTSQNTYTGQGTNAYTGANTYASAGMNANYNQGYNAYPNSTNMGMQTPPKKKKTGLIVGIIIACIVGILVLVVVAVVGFRLIMTNVNDTSDVDTEIENEYLDDEYDYSYDYDEDTEVDEDDTEETVTYDDGLIDLDGDGIGDLEYESGIEGLNAEYYPTITDYIRYDLSYSVQFLEYTDDEGKVSCFYPYLTGKHEFIPYYNQAFYMIAEGAEELADEYDCKGSSIAYVTYMDEEIFSVVFVEVYSFDDGSYYEDILCYNFNMKTGDLLDFEIIDMSDEFFDELETRCLEQSTSDATYLFSKYDNDELREIFENEEYSLVAFYTPLGMEIGMTYEGYWCCATFKDYADYIQIVEDEEDTSDF